MRPRRRRATVLLGVLGAVFLGLPGFALGGGTTKGAPPPTWGTWKNVDAYTTAKILSICPTALSCANTEDGQQTLQLLVTAQASRGGIRLVGTPRSYVGSAVSQSVRVKDIAKLAGTPGVSSIRLDDPVRSTGSIGAAVAFPSLATLFPKVDNAPAAWNAGLTGKGVGIAVIDTGVVDLPDFGGRVVHVTVDGTGVSTSAPDQDGHGTFVAGIAGGQSPDGRFVGIAPGVTIYAINVQAADGSAYASDVITALGWVRANAQAPC